jgi:diguanylate cyclase (GGDEF)-like protein
MNFLKNPIKKVTLAQRLMLFTQTVFVLMTLLIGMVMGYTVFIDSQEHIESEQQKLNHQLVARIDKELANRRDTLIPLARLLTDGTALKSLTELQHALDTRIKLHEFFNAGLVVMDVAGNLIVDSPVVPGRVGLNVADREHVKTLMQAPRAYITPPFVGRAVNEPVFHIYAPIYAHSGEVLGYVFGVTKLAQDNFLLGLSQEVLEPNRNFCVLDMANNLIVTASRPDLVLAKLETIKNNETLHKLKNGEWSGRAQNRLGEPVMFTATPLQNMNWVVVHTVAERAIFAPVWTLLWKLLILLALLLVLVVATTAWFIRRELTPLERSADQIERMVNGQTEAHALKVEREDELGQLLLAFNRLLDKQQRNIRELELAKQASDDANKAKSQFLANMSHEIRTPLNAVIGLTEMLLNDGDLPSKSMRKIQQVHGSGKLLLGIINDVLDYSKIDSGRLEVEVVKFSLNDVLEQLAVFFSEPVSKKGLELLFHVRPDVPTELLGDEMRLTQVLTNLMSNAVKFTECGEVELCIRTLPAAEGQSRLLFAVRDTGVGMTLQQRQRIFTAFMQADTSITRKHGGTGLGLVISQRLVHLMGGEKIQVESEPGKGSIFQFELTLPIAGNAHQSEYHFDCTPAPCRALVVDDQPISRLILRELLESWHFVVEEAENGEQAVAMVAAHLDEERFYKVILMDWEMPKLNGLLALRQIKASYLNSGHELDLPALLMVSGHDQSEITMTPDDDYDFLHKPFTPSGLHDAIHNLHRLTHFRVVNAHSKMRFKGQSVLVVEDNEINQEVIGEMLANLNLNVAFAADGKQGVAAVKQGNIDLVLMDIQMPVMDGYEATKEIRAFNTSLPIVALTAAAMVEDKQKALAAGMDGHLAKPISLTGLKRVMMDYLAWEPLPQTALMSEVLNNAVEGIMAAPGETDLVEKADKVLEQGKATLLIVDDEPTNARVLANGLKDDYKILLANSGDKAIKLANAALKPDLILLDIVMTGLNGYEVCQRLKNSSATSHIPIIFVSALDDSADEEKGLNLGAVDYISKPFHLPIVKSRIHNHLALKIKTDLLEKMSHMDGLTHVANRRQFDETLARETLRLARSGQSLGLVMLDVDFFKPFNDHYGHGQGDICLQKIAQALQAVIKRPGDLLARYGGEEFVVLLPETDAQGTLKMAEQLRQAVASLQLKHEYSAVAEYVTVSLGGAAAKVDSEQQGIALLKKADDALYQAKERGRNQVRFTTDN